MKAYPAHGVHRRPLHAHRLRFPATDRELPQNRSSRHLDRVHADWEVDLEVLHLEERIRPAKSFPKGQEANSPGRYSTIFGSSVEQIAWAYGQRGRNRHPVGGSNRLGGTPSIDRSSLVFTEIV